MESFSGSFGYHLSQTGNHEGGVFNGAGYHVQGSAFHVFQGSLYHAGAGNAYMDGSVSLGDAMESTGHEGVIFYGVAEFHQLGAAIGILVFGEFCCLFHHFPHAFDCIHIDAGFGGAYGYRAADALCGSQGFRNGVNENLIGRGHTPVYQGGEAAQNVYAYFIGCFLQGLCNGHIAFGWNAAGNEGNRGNGNTAVDNRHAVFSGNIMAHFRQMFGFGADGVVNLAIQGLFIIGNAA